MAKASTRRPSPAKAEQPAAAADKPATAEPDAPPAEPAEAGQEPAGQPAAEPPAPAADEPAPGDDTRPRQVSTAPPAAPLNAPGISIAGPHQLTDPNADAVTSALLSGMAAGQRRICDAAGNTLDPETLFHDHEGATGAYRVVAQRIHQEQPAAGSTHTMLRSLLHPAGTVLSRAKADELLDAVRQQQAAPA